MAFLKKAASGELIYLVRGNDRGRAAWHYVLIDKLKLALFRKALLMGQVDAAEYGQILYSGWGEQPPEETVKAVENRHG